MDGMNLPLVRASPWPVPHLSREAAVVTNRLVRRRQPIRVGKMLLGFGDVPSVATDMITFALWLGGQTGRLRTPAELVARLLATLDPAARAAQGTAACLLLELALEPALQTLEQRFPDLSLALSADSGERDGGIAFGLSCAMDGACFITRVELPLAAAAQLAGALDLLQPQRQRLATLPIPLAIRCGAVTVSLAALRSLRIGDALLPEVLNLGEPLLIAGERFCWHAQRSADALSVITARQILQEASRMSATAITNDDTASLDELPIRLTFEFGRLELTLAELEALGPGHVFALGRNLRGPVDILANGKRFGIGDIVSVGDALGVRITQLGDA